MSSTSAKSSWVLAVLLGLSAAVAVAAPPLKEELVSREPQAESLFCPRARCGGDWNCEGICPGAVSATCVDFYCEFDMGGDPGGGGNPGGGPGPVCPGMRCGGDWNCVCEGLQGTCGPDYMCVF